MLIAALFIVLISVALLILSHNSRLTAVIVSHFVCISGMIIIGLIYMSKSTTYQPGLRIDYEMYLWLSSIRLNIIILSSVYNLLIAAFMITCLFYVSLCYKIKAKVLIPAVIPAAVFLYCTNYYTCYDMFIRSFTSSSLYVRFFNACANYICEAIFMSYLCIPLLLLAIKICTAKIFTSKRNYLVEGICYLLFVSFIYIIFVKGYFSCIWFSNVDKFKLATGIRVYSERSVVGLLIALTITVMLLLFFFRPFGAFMIIRRSTILENARRRNKNISMLLHVYKNAFLALGQQITLAKKNIQIDKTEDAIYNLDYGSNVISEYMDSLEKTLSLLRGNVQKKSTTDVIKCIDSAAKGIEGADILKLFPDTHIEIWGEKEKITEVFTNLFLNAVEAKRNDVAGILIRFTTDDNYCMISVRDDGKGIPKQELTRVFEPFYSTKANVHCGGIGLTYVKEVVIQCGGDIRVLSKVNEFTEFQIVFRTYKARVK